MFCPVCGQEQISNEVRFCSRCGFLLNTVNEVVANGGVLPQLLELNKNKKWLTRKNGIKFAVVWVATMWFLIAPLGGIARIPQMSALAGVLGFAGLILSLLISFLFLRSEPKFSSLDSLKPQSNYPVPPSSLKFGTAASQGALPPQQSIPVSSYVPPVGKWQDTNDLAVPPSVTDSTTKLLQKDE